MPVIVNFHKKYAFLSLEDKFEVTYKGIKFSNLKRLYAASRFHSLDMIYLCADDEQCSDVEINYFCNYVTSGTLVTSRFEQGHFNILCDILKLKFTQEPYRTKLLETGDATLINLTRGQPKLGKFKGQGEDLLGRALMTVRDELRNTSEVKLNTTPKED